MGKEDQGIRVGQHRYQVIPRVLVFLRNGNDILLLRGASTKQIWPDLYNGVGGHIEPYENVYTAACREVQEETGLLVPELNLKAVVNIDAGTEGVGIMMFVFTGWSHERKTIASSEGALEWVPADQISDFNLVEDLTWLLPRVLQLSPGASPLFLHYTYDNADTLVIREANHDGSLGIQGVDEP